MILSRNDLSQAIIYPPKRIPWQSDFAATLASYLRYLPSNTSKLESFSSSQQGFVSRKLSNAMSKILEE
jgi:hypothetical protein